jgi:hypothetical protein
MTRRDREYSTVLPALASRVVHETRQRLLSDSGLASTALREAFRKLDLPSRVELAPVVEKSKL